MMNHAMAQKHYHLFESNLLIHPKLFHLLAELIDNATSTIQGFLFCNTLFHF